MTTTRRPDADSRRPPVRREVAQRSSIRARLIVRPPLQYLALAAYMIFLGFPLLFLLTHGVQDAARAAVAEPRIPADELQLGQLRAGDREGEPLHGRGQQPDRRGVDHRARHRDLAAGGLRARPVPHQAARPRDGLDPAQPGVPVHPDHHSAVPRAEEHRPDQQPASGWSWSTPCGRCPSRCGCCRATSPGSRSSSKRPARWTARAASARCARSCSRCSRRASSPPVSSRSSRRGTSSSSPWCSSRIPSLQTLPLALARFVGAEGQVQLGQLAAASLLATIPSLVFFLLIQKRLTAGLLSGAVKG